LPWQQVTVVGHTTLLFAHQPAVASKVITLNTAGKAYLNASEVAFLGAFPKLQKATISSVMSVRPPARPYGRTRLPLDGFSLNLIYEDFSKIRRETSGFIKI
jgi:hypothetical protein